MDRGIVERGILAPRMMFDRLPRKAKFLILRILLEHCLDSKDRDKVAPSGIEDHYRNYSENSPLQHFLTKTHY
jgi:hypothetical protein